MARDRAVLARYDGGLGHEEGKVMQRRLELIRRIEGLRGSKVVTYLLGDRQPFPGVLAEDAVRPMYDHLRTVGHEKVPKIDLYLYSRGGFTEVPWRIVSMIREHCKTFGVLVPYKAHSAATLIALGADEIVMGRKGELGPVDPALNLRRPGEGGTVVQEEIRVEDVMAYLLFLRDRAGLKDQAALAETVKVLPAKLPPWTVGSIYRAHSNIRLVAQKLLASHSLKMEKRRSRSIIDALTEKIYQHGHAIGRQEAMEIGLPIVEPEPELEDAMWELFNKYEDVLQLPEPVDPNVAIPSDEDEVRNETILGCIESETVAHEFACVAHFWQQRQPPPQLNLKLDINLNLPAGIDPKQIPQQAQQILQTILGQLQQQVSHDVQKQVRQQMPVIETRGRTEGGKWRLVKSWPGTSA
jgi:hypothetical protein